MVVCFSCQSKSNKNCCVARKVRLLWRGMVHFVYDWLYLENNNYLFFFLICSELTEKDSFINALIDKFGMNISNFNDMRQCTSFMRNCEACCKETQKTKSLLWLTPLSALATASILLIIVIVAINSGNNLGIYFVYTYVKP